MEAGDERQDAARHLGGEMSDTPPTGSGKEQEPQILLE